MRRVLLVLLVVFPALGFGAERGYIQEFYDARRIEGSDPEGAFEGMMRSYRLALAAGNADYATSAGLCAGFLLHRRGEIVQSGNLAHEVLDAIGPLPADFVDNDILRRGQLFGLMEPGLQVQGKIGQAWRANRATAEILRGRRVSPDGDGASITLKEVIRLQPDLRGLGWRLIEREADLLDIAGRTREARVLLDETAAYLGDDWLEYPGVVRFYAFKLLASRAMILDFLGYEQEAIRAQQELEAACKGLAVSESSKLILRINLLRNLSQWNGPSEGLLAEVRETVDRLKKPGRADGTERILAKMELALHESQAAIHALRADSENNASLGRHFDAMYSDRDLLLARAKQGEGDLDAEFMRLLAVARAQGNKRAEPTLYHSYGSYLLDRNRPVEAVAMFTEALRLTRAFGWTLHEPGLLRPLFDARFAAGDLIGARATLAEMEVFLAANPDMPAARRVLAETGRAMALARLGETDAARAALARAREIAVDLPDYKKRWLTSEAETVILAASPAVPVVVADTPPLKVQPLGVVSLAAPGGPARTRFVVFNPAESRIEGHWKVHGPGATVSGNAVAFDVGKPVVSVAVANAVGSGDEAVLACSLVAAEGVESADIRIAWENAGRDAGPASAWNVSWDPAAKNSVVLDAGSLESNPFRYTTLFHELAVPVGEDLGVPFRLRSPVPLRFEYYEARSQQLLAIDANGNGDFTEPGDLHVRGPNGVTAAMVPVTAADHALTVEIHIFMVDGHEPAPAGGTLVLEAEVSRNGVWTMEAQDVLKP